MLVAVSSALAEYIRDTEIWHACVRYQLSWESCILCVHLLKLVEIVQVMVECCFMI